MNISALRRKARPFLPAPGMRRQCWPRTRAREGLEVSHQPRGNCINELMNRMRPSPCYKRGDPLRRGEKYVLCLRSDCSLLGRLGKHSLTGGGHRGPRFRVVQEGSVWRCPRRGKHGGRTGLPSSLGALLLKLLVSASAGSHRPCSCPGDSAEPTASWTKTPLCHFMNFPRSGLQEL